MKGIFLKSCKHFWIGVLWLTSLLPFTRPTQYSVFTCGKSKELNTFVILIWNIIFTERLAGAVIHSVSKSAILVTLSFPGHEFRISFMEMIKVGAKFQIFYLMYACIMRRLNSGVGMDKLLVFRSIFSVKEKYFKLSYNSEISLIFPVILKNSPKLYSFSLICCNFPRFYWRLHTWYFPKILPRFPKNA